MLFALSVFLKVQVFKKQNKNKKKRKKRTAQHTNRIIKAD